MNEQLLLVEDDDAVADVMRLHLAQAGYQVQREIDGLRAIAAIDRRPWDLVLLDLTLPGADGHEVCRHLRARHAHVPIIMVSARSAEVQRILGLELGADDYLAKPFSMMELVARVRALLRRVEQLRAPTAVQAELRFGLFRLDPVRRLLHRGDPIDAAQASPIALTLREFDLLHFLARHPAQVFSRADLLQRVWGAGFDGFEHTVNSHINRLRAKLDAGQTGGTDSPLIETVWGMGYRFNPGPGRVRPG